MQSDNSTAIKKDAIKKTTRLLGLLLITAIIIAMITVFASSSKAETQPRVERLTIAVDSVEYYQKHFGEAIIKPFEALHNVSIDLVAFKHDYSQFKTKKNKDSDTAEIDILDVPREYLNEACENEWLQPNDWFTQKQQSDDGDMREVSELDERIYIDSAYLSCGIGHAITAYVFAYNRNTFSTNKPTSIKDFFNIIDFPGQRIINNNLIAVLEWALLSYDVPPHQVYSLLSTERGLNLAFKKLDKIRPAIVWWQNDQEVFKLLQSKEPMLVAGPHDLFFEAEMAYALPLDIVWDNNVSDMLGLALVKPKAKYRAEEADETVFETSQIVNESLAKAYILYMTSASNQAKLANLWPLGPTNNSSLNKVANHPDYRVPMDRYLPSIEERFSLSLSKDSLWYRRAEKIIALRFEKWKNAKR